MSILNIRCGQDGCEAGATAELVRQLGLRVIGAEGWSWDSVYGWRCPEHISPLRAARSEEKKP